MKKIVFFFALTFPFMWNNAFAQSNTFYGASAGNKTTTGSENSAFGNYTGLAMTNAIRNTLMGYFSGYSLTSGGFNTMIGANSGSFITTGGFNTFVGTYTGFQTSSSMSNNTFIGGATGFNLSGNENTIVGSIAGRYNDATFTNTLLSGNGLTFLGFKTTASENLTNATAIGYQARVTANNSLVLGNSLVNVGIGTTAPTTKLEVNSATAGVSGIKLTQLTSSSTAAAANGKALSVDASGNVILVTAGSGTGGDNLGNHTATTALNMNSQNIVSVNSLGIGTASPSAKLEVNSGTIANAGLKFTQLNASSPTAAANGKALTVDASGNVILVPASTGSGTSYWTLNTANNNITNSNTGCVVIGSTITSFPTGYKLFVEGGIMTERVKVAVKNTANWADYVFATNYRLRPLSEVAQHIQQYKHLPDVPSAQEVVNSGLDLAENQAKLLQKIEELTLYVIEQDKQIKHLQKQVKGLRK
jgi:trimeric autotransporter adhesin